MSVGDRIGWLTSPDTLVYGLAAYTEGGYNLGATLGGGGGCETICASSGTDALNVDVDVSGYTLGAGLETRLKGDWTLKGEYRFTQFDDERTIDDVTIDGEASIHTARAVLSYRFNPFKRNLDSYK
jgi:outer membrane immunogenic protein